MFEASARISLIQQKHFDIIDVPHKHLAIICSKGLGKVVHC